MVAELRRAGLRAAVAGSGVAYLAAIAWSGAHVGLNDFWGNVALAQHADWSSPASFYNQFFPFGYTLVLKIFGSHPLLPALMLSVAAALWLLAVVGRVTTRLLGESWAILAVLAVACHPQVFRYATTPGPDIVTAAFLAAGFDQLFRTTETDPRSARWAGLLFGLAAVFRYHALMFAAAAIVARVASLRRVRPVLLVVAGLGAVYSLQMLVSVLAGYGPLHTGQAWIFYKLMHPLDWADVARLPVPSSALAVVMAEPRTFALAYVHALASLWPLTLSAAALGIWSSDARRRQFGQAAFVTIVLYLLAVAGGGSSRGTLPSTFIVVIASIALGVEALVWFRSRLPGLAAAGIVATAALVWGLLSVREDFGVVKYRAIDHAAFTAVQAVLESDGVRTSSQVFSSDFDIYFPSMPGYVPRTNGTWLRLGPPPDQLPPELCLATTECFVRDAKQSDVTHVVLSGHAAEGSTVLGRISAGQAAEAFEPRGAAGGFAIFRIR